MRADNLIFLSPAYRTLFSATIAAQSPSLMFLEGTDNWMCPSPRPHSPPNQVLFPSQFHFPQHSRGMPSKKRNLLMKIALGTHPVLSRLSILHHPVSSATTPMTMTTESPGQCLSGPKQITHIKWTGQQCPIERQMQGALRFEGCTFSEPADVYKRYSQDPHWARDTERVHIYGVIWISNEIWHKRVQLSSFCSQLTPQLLLSKSYQCTHLHKWPQEHFCANVRHTLSYLFLTDHLFVSRHSPTYKKLWKCEKMGSVWWWPWYRYKPRPLRENFCVNICHTLLSSQCTFCCEESAAYHRKGSTTVTHRLRWLLQQSGNVSLSRIGDESATDDSSVKREINPKQAEGRKVLESAGTIKTLFYLSHRDLGCWNHICNQLI